jgi:hypothetical protein
MDSHVEIQLGFDFFQAYGDLAVLAFVWEDV